MVKDVTSTFFTMHFMFLGGLFNANQHLDAEMSFSHKLVMGTLMLESGSETGARA